MAKKFIRSKENLDFLDSVRYKLGDQRPKSFGLYVKLFKEFGRQKMRKALAFAKEKPIDYRLKYFLGILMQEREKKQARKTIFKPQFKEGTAAEYFALREKLIKKMTPRHERSSRIRSRLQIRVSREERRLRRNKKNLSSTN